jgi:hypothetical protein
MPAKRRTLWQWACHIAHYHTEPPTRIYDHLMRKARAHKLGYREARHLMVDCPGHYTQRGSFPAPQEADDARE